MRKRDNPTSQQVADRFSVGIASVARRSKNPAIKAYVRVRTRKIDLNLLALDVEIYPDADQDERAERFG
ncbi:MAG: transposase, partial [Alphaproteobacteria bacterium]|nr:transposase [Alphaproteobacteria bacterium]